MLSYRYSSALASVLEHKVNPSFSNKNIYCRSLTKLGHPFWGGNWYSPGIPFLCENLNMKKKVKKLIFPENSLNSIKCIEGHRFYCLLSKEAEKKHNLYLLMWNTTLNLKMHWCLGLKVLVFILFWLTYHAFVITVFLEAYLERLAAPVWETRL